MALGRPVMQDYTVPLPEAIDDDHLTDQSSISQPHHLFCRVAFMVRALKFNKILAHILRTIYEPEYFAKEGTQFPTHVSQESQSIVDTEAVLKLEAELLKFYRDIPEVSYDGTEQEMKSAHRYFTCHSIWNLRRTYCKSGTQ